MTEQQNIEFKESWRDEYLKWICGFANAQGGRIYIGVNDTGEPVGVPGFEKFLEEIPNKVISHLGIVLDVNLKLEKGKDIIEIVVLPSEVAISYHGAYYYRSGSTKQELRGAALQEFLLKKMGRSWDDTPLPGATLKDIDTDAVKSFLEKAIDQKRISPDAGKDEVESVFNNLHLINENGKIKSAAVLLFGKDPQKFFTHSYFKIGRFGTSDHDLKFQDVIEGNVFEMPDKVFDVLKRKYLVAPIRYEGLLRKEVLEYPEAALKEAILNAIVHKNYVGTSIQLSVYDDKLMLWNPGSLPAEISIEQLKKKHSSFPRNKNLADIFFKSGYVEAWGRGISKIIDACRQAGLPEPIFEEHAGGLMVTLFKELFPDAMLRNLGLSDRQISAVQYVKLHNRISNKDYQELFSVSRGTATRDLTQLAVHNIIQVHGRGPGAYYTLLSY
jgi:ATP-dependent DNA helicase RecG